MKVYYWALYLFLTSLNVCFGQNQYLPNGDFSKGMTNWKIDHGNVQKVKTLPLKNHLFEYVLEIDARESNAIGIKSDPFKIDTLCRYQFSAMVKRLGAGLHYNITLHWLDKNEEYIGREYAHVATLVGIDWVPWRIEAIAPEEAIFGQIVVELQSGTGCQLADIRIEKIESTGPKLAIDFIPEAIHDSDFNLSSKQYNKTLKIRFENRSDVILENIEAKVKLSNISSNKNKLIFKKKRLSYAQDFTIKIPLQGNVLAQQSQVEVVVNCIAESKKIAFKAKDVLFATYVSKEIETETKDLLPPIKPDTKINLGCYYFPVMLDWNRNNWGVRPVEYMEPRLGYYNEALPEVADWHIYWALNHGISFFVFDWYYNKGLDYLNDALDKGFLKSRFRDQMEFCLDWCNEGHCGQFKQVGFDQEALELFITTLCKRYFKYSNYLQINDKPVVIIHVPVNLINAYGSYERCQKALGMMRTIARNHGYKGVYFIALQNNLPYLLNYAAAGFDCVTSYAYGYRDVPVDWETRTLPYEALIPRHRECFEIAQKEAHKQHLDYIPSAWVGWDDNARSKENAIKTHGNSPGALRRMVQMLPDYVEPNTKLALLEAWNEWGEGGNIEPGKFYGFTRLAAVKDAIAKDNGPYTIAVPTKRDIKAFNTNATWSDVHNMYLQRYAKTLGLNNGLNMDFLNPNGLCFSAKNNAVNLTIKDGLLKFHANGNDPTLIGPPFMELPAENVTAIEFRMKLNSGKKGSLYWTCSQDMTWNESKSQHFNIIADNEWHNYYINLTNNNSWQGLIQQFRFDPTDAIGNVEIGFFRTIMKNVKKKKLPWGII